MTKIIVGIDGSESAAQALRWAVDEARLHDGEVTAVGAWTLLDQLHPGTEPRFDPDYHAADARDALASHVRAALGEAQADRVDAVELLACNDLPAPALIDASDGADLLVIGGRGLGGLKGQLLGSVSYRVLQHARCPVAVVRASRPPADPAAVPRVVVGVDGSANAQRALEWAVAEARVRGAQLEVVHAWQVSYAGAGAYGVVAIDTALFEEPARDALDRIVGEIDITGLAHPVGSRLFQGSAARALLDASGDADLVVVGSRGLGGFAGLLLGSTTTQVVHHAECPVVVLPAEG